MSDWRSRAKKVEPEGPRAPADPGEPKASGWRARSTVVETPPPPPPRAPGPTGDWGDGFRALLAGAERGLTSDYSDELGGVWQTSADLVSRTMPRAVNDALGIESRYREPLSLDSALNSYRQAREENRHAYENTQARAPEWVTDLGNFGGAMLQPTPFGKGAAVKGLTKALWKAGDRGGAAKVVGKLAGKAAGRGATEGGIGGLGASKADLTKGDPKEWARVALDLGLSTGIGAGAGPLGELFGAQVLGPLSEWAGDKLQRSAARRANSILTNGAGTFKGGKVAVPEEVGLQALDDRSIRMLGTTQGAADRATETIEGYGKKTYGPMMDAFSGAGIGTRLADMRGALQKESKATLQGTTSTELRDFFNKKADDFAETYGDRTGRTARLPPGPGVRGRPFADPNKVEVPIKQSENWKQFLQQEAREGYKRKEPTPMLEAKMRAAAIIQGLNEEAIEKATSRKGVSDELRKAGEDFIPVKQLYGRRRAVADLATDAADTNARKAPKPGVLAKTANFLGGQVLRGEKSGELGTILQKALSDFAKERAPSTAAVGTYLASKAAKAIAQKPGQHGTKAARSAQRTFTPELSEAFWERFAPKAPPPEETEEQRRLRELRETLYPYGNQP